MINFYDKSMLSCRLKFVSYVTKMKNNYRFREFKAGTNLKKMSWK